MGKGSEPESGDRYSPSAEDNGYVDLLAKMSDDAPVSITVHDLEGNILYANEETFRLHGFTRKEFLAKNLHEIDVPESEKLIAVRMQEIQEKGEADFDVQHFRKDGSKIPLHTNVKIVDWGGRKVLLSIATDLTERRIAERAVAESEERFHAIFDAASDGLLLADSETQTFRMANVAIQKQLGYTEAELLSLSVSDILRPADLPRANVQFGRQGRGEITLASDCPVLRKDGTVYYADVSATPVTLEGRQYLLGIFRDITDRKKAEEAQKASEIRYRRLFEAALDGILILDAETGQIVEVNPVFIRMLGFSHEEFLGKKIWEIGLFRDIIANKDNFKELQQKESIRYEDMPIETADGQTIAVEFVSSLYRVNDQKVIQCNIRDITERKEAEDRIRIINEQLTAERTALKRTQKELHSLNIRLEEKVRERTAELETSNVMLSEQNRTLQILNAGTSALLNVQDEAGFIPLICTDLVKSGGYSHVWLAGFNDKGNVGIVGADGDECLGFSDMIAGRKLPPCAEPVIKAGGVQVIEKLAPSCSGCPLSLLHKNHAMIIARLDAGGKPVGLLGITLLPETFPTAQETGRIAQISQELAFVIQYLRIKEREQKAYLQISKNIEQLATLNDEIRNPLQVILAYASMGDKEILENIQKCTDRIDAIVDQLDNGCLRSKKIHDYLILHQEIREEPGRNTPEKESGAEPEKTPPL